MTRLLLSLLLVLAALAAPAQGLKDAYDGLFRVGVAVTGRDIADSASAALILREFNSLTCENAMKPAVLHPAPGVWHFDEADRVADFARRHRIPLRGHCLLWHAQFADWMYTAPDGTPASPELFLQRLRDHIHTVVRRYRDIVYCWDVANEAIADAGPDLLRATPYARLLGEEAILKAFEYAHEADPHALLFYNDYNAFEPAKRERIATLLAHLKAQGAPIDGMGLQGHYNIYGPDMALVDTALTRYAALVPHLQITELDIRMNHDMGGALDFERARLAVDPAKEERQAAAYEQLFAVLRRHAAALDAATFWNLHDGVSWVGEGNHPLLFDARLRRKAAYGRVAYGGAAKAAEP